MSPLQQPIALKEESDGLLADVKSDGPQIERCELKLEGMTCGACVEVRV